MKKFIFAIFSFILCSCSVQYGPFTIVSNKTLDLENLNIEKTKKVSSYTGKAKLDIITPYAVPFGTMNPNLSTAMNSAYEHLRGGDFYTNAFIHEYWFIIPFIWGQSAISITGDIVKLDD